MAKKKFIDSILGEDASEEASEDLPEEAPEETREESSEDTSEDTEEPISRKREMNDDEQERYPASRAAYKEEEDSPDLAPVKQQPEDTHNKELVTELVQSNLSLEKVTVDVLDAITKLATRMDRLLSLFEEAAKNMDRAEGIQENQPLGKQLEQLLEQNRVIARGLVLIEKYIRERSGNSFTPSTFEPKKLPRNNF